MTEYKVHRVRFVEYEPQGINCIAFEDCLSAPRLAVSRQDGSIQIWSTWPSLYWSIDFVIPGRIGRSIDTISWCDSRLFSAGLEGEVIEWDLMNIGEKFVIDANGGPVWCISASHDKLSLAAGCEDGSVRLFSTEGGCLEYKQTLNKQEFRVLSLAWSHGDQQIVTGSTDSTIRIYDVKSKRIITRISTDKLRERNTLIWSISLTEDMTIITGDSLGQTQFWDSNVGTLLQSFKSHEADVLAVCVSNDEKSVYSSGIDSQIAEFHFVKGEGFEDGEWGLSRKIQSVNHDIRAIAVTSHPKKFLVSGGIDPRLSKFKITHEQKKFIFLPTFPENVPCSFGRNANFLMFHEKNLIHMWKISTIANPLDPIQTPQKIMQLKSSRDHYITCCDVSCDGKAFAYADIQGITAFGVNIPENALTDMQVSKLKIPQKHFKGTQSVKFTADGSKIVIACHEGIAIIDLLQNMKVHFIKEFQKNENKFSIRLLAVDDQNDIFASLNSRNEIDIYSIIEDKHLVKIPKPACKPMALAIQSGTSNVVYICAEKDLHIFDFKTEKLNPWCKELNETKVLKKLPTTSSNFVNMVFDQKDRNVLFLQSENGFVKIRIGAEIHHDKTQNEVGKKRKISGNKEEKSMVINSMENVLKSTRVYSSILYLDVTSENELVIVERPMEEVINALPPALKVKKYGT